MSFYADQIVGLVWILTKLEMAQTIGETAIAAGKIAGAVAGDRPATERMRELMRMPARSRQNIEAAGLQMCLKSFDRLVQAADDPNLTIGHAREYAEDLTLRLSDELTDCSFWQVPRAHQYLLESDLFGPEVSKAFPSACSDIEEAGTCLAFGRGTAGVFHLMRILERGLRSLAETLKDPNLDPARNPSWDSILKKCEAEQRKPIAERAAEWRSDEKFFSDVHATLRAVKDGWRNPSLHVERNYTTEQALEIFVTTRAFMQRLAAKMREVSSIVGDQ
ncbi:MAG: hypothetical protein ACREQI_04520 [Candidatus Binataceae bacterium]